MIEATPLSVSPEKAAALTGIGRTRIFELMRTGALPSFKCGRTRHIRYTDLRAFVDRMAAEDRTRPQPGDAA